jgi:hypothetical protein
MSRMSELHADMERVCRVIPIRQEQQPPPCPLALSERTALALMCSDSPSRHHRAEIIRAAAVGDMGRIIKALEGWTNDQ